MDHLNSSTVPLRRTWGWLKSALFGAALILIGSVHAQNVNVTATAGTPAATYATLNAAFGAINAGTHQGAITCTVVANTTEPAVSIPLLPSGGSSSYSGILINCVGNVTVNSAAAPTASRGVIEIQGDNVTIDGDDPGTSGTRNLTFAAAPVATVGVATIRFASPSAADGATLNTIKNCIVIGSRNLITSTVVNFGIYAGVNGTGTTSATGTGDNLDNLTIENNEVRRCFWGIYVSGTAANKADNLTIRNNQVGSSTAADAVVNRGIYIQNTQSASSAASAIVEGNDVSIRADAGGTTNDIANIEVANGNAGARIRNNKIHDGLQASTGGQGCYGIFVTGATDNSNIEISNNFIWDLNNDNWSTSIAATSADIPIGIKVSVAVTGLKILHNSISLNKANNDPATAGYSACLQLHSTAATGSDIRNNIFSNTQVAQPTSVHVCVLVPAGFPFNLINNNVYYDTQSYTHVGWNGAVRSTLANWQAQTLQDAASTSADPSFVSTTDLHIAGTPASLNNAGALAGVVLDIDNDFRSSPPDIGADEFTTNPCGAAVASVNYVQDCGNNQFFLDVTVTALNGSTTVNVGSDFAGNPGADNNVGIGTYQIGPFASNSNVQVLITSNTSALCNTTVGTFNFDCATNGQNALSFDGVNDRVNIPNSTSVNITGTQVTLEAWIYPTAFRTGTFEGSIINKEGTGNSGYMLRCGGNGVLSFAIGTGTSFVEVTSPAATLTLNTWQHVAGIYNGATMRIFKDGVQVGTLAQTASIPSSASVPLVIGNWTNDNGRGFPGLIDEARIWNVARTPTQLTSNLGRVLCGTEPGLQAYYQFNQGTAGGNNAAVTSLTDFTANANTGTLANLALSGLSSNWVVGRTGLNACALCEQATATAVVTQDCANSQFFINVTVSALNGNTSVDVLSNFGGNPGGQTGVGVGSYQLGPFPSNTNVVVNVNPTGAPDCNLAFSGLTYDCSTFGQNALSFDGTNDRVDCGTSPSVSITGTTITLEAWIFPTAWQASSFQGSIINKEGPNQGYMLRCGNNGQLSFALGNGTSVPEVLSATGTLTLNTWQHVAGTYDGTTLRIYRNGVQVGSTTSTFTIANSTNQLTIGDYAVTPGTRVFIGKIDEARIWSVARSASELAANQLVQPCPGTDGLRAYYQFDQGVESGNNAGVTTLPDISGNGNNGTLVNFALTGPTSNWVTGRTGFTICPTCTGVPVAGTIGGTASVCAGASNVLSVTGATIGLGITYQWKYRANGSSDPYTNLGTSTSQNTSGLPIGVWEVVFDVTCSDGPNTTSSLPFVLTVNQVPTATASSNSPVCAGTTLNLTGTTDIGTTFNWSGPASFASTDQNATRVAMIAAWAGTYSFTATANGCTSSPSTVSVAVDPSPVINSTTATPNPVCNGSNAQLQVNTVPPGYLIGSGGASFIDISGTGTSVGVLGDDTEHNITIPNFSFNGVTYTAGRVGTNGALVLGATTGDVSLTNATLPSAAHSAGNVFLAPWWDDLDIQTAPSIVTQTVGSKFILQFTNMDHNDLATGTNGVTFQIQMDLTTGVIHFVYTDVLFGNATYDAGASATVGIQWANAAGGFAQSSFNTASLTNGQVISFTPGSFTYLWTPSTGLSANNIANPVATAPSATTAYSVQVTGSNGCFSTGNLSLVVNEVPDLDLAVVDDCNAAEFSISVLVNSTGNSPTVNLSYTVNGGAPTVVSGLGVGAQAPLGPFLQLDEVVVSIVDPVGGCNSTLPVFRSACPEIVTCPNTLVKNYCYTNNDTRTWTFTSSNPNETLTLTFISGTIDAAGDDVLRIYSGTDDSGPLLASSSVSDLAGLTATSEIGTSSIYMEVVSDASNSCQDAGQTAWLFEVECTPGCTDPDGIVSLTTDCIAYTFSLDVEVTGTGDAVTTDLSYTVNGGPATIIPGLIAFDIENIGPFALGDVVNVFLLHESDNSCDRNLGNFTQSVSFCPNNEPCDARPVTVNADYSCAVTSPGTMVGATLTAGITGGCTGVNQDVWYQFVASAPTHRITLGGTTTGLSYSLYTGATCSGLTLHPGFACITGATVTNYNGLTAGTTYYLRVSRTTAGTNVFTVCVGAPPAADIGQNALHFEGTTTGSNDRVNCGTDASIDITGNTITMEAWIFPTAWRVSSFQGNIINKEGGNTGYMLRCGNNGQLSANIGTGTGFVERISATAALTLNTWQHVAATYDGTNLRIYRDGVELTPATSTGTLAPIASAGPLQQLTIGNWSQDNTRGFVGRIDEVRIWNTALSGATIAANLNQQLCGGEAGLRAYYAFDQGVDGGNNVAVTTLLDLSGNGNNGTLANMTLTGPTSNWVQGRTGMVACPPCATAPTAGTVNGVATVCAGVPHNLNLIGATTGTGISYQWYYGPVGNPTANLLGTSLLQSTASIPSGTWELVADVTCAGFGTATTVPFTFTKNPTPTATVQLSPAGVCIGNQFSVLGLTDIGTTFVWTGPNAFTSTSQNAIVNATAAPTNAGTYSFTATANGCTSPTATAVLTVNTNPVVTSTTATPNPICENTGTSQLSAVAPISGYTMGSSGTTFIDISGTGTAIPGVGDDSEHNITIPGGFTFNGVSLTDARIGANGVIVFGATTGEITLANAALPTGAVAAGNAFLAPWWDDIDNDAGGGQIFTGQSGNLFIAQWNNWGRSAAVAGQVITFQVQLDLVTGQIFFVYPDVLFGGTQAVANDNGLNATVGIQWANAAGSAIQYSFNTASLTNGQVISFTPNGSAITWSPATNLSDANIPNPVFGPVAAGSYLYTVTATNTATGCFGTATLTVNVNPALTAGQANITPASPFFCGTGTVTLTANATGGGAPYTYAWTDPNSAAAGTNQTVAAGIAGTWSVTITDACGGTATATMNVTQNPVPTASATASLGCIGQDLNLTGTTDIGTTYAWTGPNGFTSSVQNPVISAATLAAGGTYTFTTTEAGCTSLPATVSVTMNATPVLAVPASATPATVCEGTNSQLNVTVTSAGYFSGSGGASFIDISGTGTSVGTLGDDTEHNITIPNFVFNGVTYTAGRVGTNGALVLGATTGEVSLSNAALPSAAHSAGNVFLAPWWDDLDIQTAPSIRTQTVGSKFIVQFTNLDHNLVALGTNGVTFQIQMDLVTGVIHFVYTDVIFGNASFDAGASATVGIQWANSAGNFIQSSFNTASLTNGQVISFTPNSTTYAWTGPNSFSSSLQNPVITGATAANAGLYTVTGTSASGCAVQSTVTLNVQAAPIAGTNGSTTLCINAAATDLFDLLGGTPAATGTWSGPSVLTGGNLGTFTPGTSAEGVYTYTVVGTAPCANATATVTVSYDNTDSDNDGVINCLDNCPNLFGQIGQACNAGPGFVLGVINASCACVGVQCTTDLTLEFQTDSKPFETTWEIRTQGTNLLAQSGGPLNAPNGVETSLTCLPDGCYELRVLDSFGDGMTTGGYILRTQVTNLRIIDNRNNFSTGFNSTISGGQGFCLPMSNQTLLFTSCDKLDWVNNQYVVAAPDAAVSAEWIPNGANTVQDANSGYEFWIFNPNGGYSFRRFRSHNVSDGFGPASATRACHMRLNNWAVASQVPANVLMNVRVRTRIDGVNGEFGPACRLAINPTLAACPETQLMNIPGDPNFSCGAIRQWGTGNFVHARPVAGANRYQFRFRIAAEGFSVTRTVTTYFTQLNWTVLPLQDGKTYDVDVRVSKDAGATWCSVSDPWGPVCQLTIDNTPAGNGNQNFAGISEAAELRMFPNPNRGDLLNFSLSAIEEGVNTVSVDIYDLSGARVTARTIAVAGGNVNTVLDLNGELAAGMYLVNITAGDKSYTERLVIQP
jgi:parallel beta-helix repeat protein